MRPGLSLADFVDEELLRAPMVFDAAIDAVDLEWRKQQSVVGRSGHDLSRTLGMHRTTLAAAALRTLRLAATRDVSAVAQAAESGRDVSLIDEADIVADLETGRCAELIASEAEAQLREIQAYTSALVGEDAVSRDTNPFQPGRWARALWDGCQAMPIAPAVQIDAYRRAAKPLASAVRNSLAGACRRLEALGVTPASYRTLIFPTVPAAGVRERVRARDETPTTPRAYLPGTGGTDNANDEPAAPQVRLVRRLVHEIAAEAGLPVAMLPLLSRLGSALEHVAADDEAMVQRLDHPAWVLVDRLAFLLAVTPAAEQPALHELARNLVARLFEDTAPDAARFAWAAAKLDMHDRQALTFAVRTASAEIARLKHDLPAFADTGGGGRESRWLDTSGLETVPAQLLEALPVDNPADGATVLRPAVGDRLRIFLQGEWRWLQLLWSQDDLWLLRELASPAQWALQPGVTQSLQAAHLVRPLRMRSLVQRAAERLHRRQ